MSTSRRPDGHSRPKAALHAFGINASKIARVRRGLVSWHWYVSTHRAQYVLRRYNPWREDIAFEHRVLSFLAEKGWPVAAPIRTHSGETAMRLDEETYALFPRLPGRARWSHSPLNAHERGRLLARLHQSLAPLSDWEQRTGTGQMHRYADRPMPPLGRTFTDVLPSFKRAHSGLGHSLARHHARVSEQLEGFDVLLPRSVIHGDFCQWNLLYSGGELSGILDFDFTRLDLRVTDVAIAARFEPDIDPWRAFVEGYASVLPMTEGEVDAFVPLCKARSLIHAASVLGFWETGREDLVEQVQIAVAELERDTEREEQLVSAASAALGLSQRQ